MIGIVTKNYRIAYTDPLAISKGETLTLGKRDTEWVGWIWCTSNAGKGGWVPERYLRIEGEGDTGLALEDYSAAELDVDAGDELAIHTCESGWYWATNRKNESGWIPMSHIQVKKGV